MGNISFINHGLEKKYNFLKANPTEILKNRTEKLLITDSDLQVIIDYLEFMFSHYLITNKQYKEFVTDEMKKEWHSYEKLMSESSSNYIKKLPECKFILNIFNCNILVQIKQTEYRNLENYNELCYEFLNSVIDNR